MNAFSFLQFLLPLITPIYTFSFKKEEMISSFKDKIVVDSVSDISFKDEIYKVKTKEEIFYSKNLVLATDIGWSQRFAGVNRVNKPVSTNMLHIQGIPNQCITRKKYQLYSPPSMVQGIADLHDGTYLFYFKNEQPSLEDFFINPKILAQHFWNPAGRINGHILIESNRENNLYLIGDYNVAGLEEAFITGIFAANQIINI